MDPMEGSPAAGKTVARIINLFAGDLFGTGGNEMEQRVLTRLRNDFHASAEDWHDVAFTRQGIRWTQDSQNEPYIEVGQEKAFDELEEISAKDDSHYTSSMQTINVQKPSGTDELATKWYTIPMLLQIFQMRFGGSFSNSSRC